MPALQAWGRLEAKMRNMAEARRLFQVAVDVEPDNEYVLTVRHWLGHRGCPTAMHGTMSHCYAGRP